MATAKKPVKKESVKVTDKKILVRLKDIGITSDDESVIREKLKEILEPEEVPVEDTDELTDLIDYAEVFVKNDDKKEVKAGKKATPADEEDDSEEAAEEDATEEEDDDKDTPPVVPVKKKQAPVVPLKKKAAVKEPEAETQEEDEEEGEEETEAPAKKAAPKKAAKKVAEKTEKTRGVRFDPLNNEEHDALLNPLRKFFKDAKTFEVRPLNNGVSIFILAKSSKIIIFSLKNGAVVNKDVVGVLWNNRFKRKNVDAYHKLVDEDFLGDSVKIGVYEKDPLVTCRRISITQWLKVLKETELLQANLDQVSALDKRMTSNREKLEQSLQSGKNKKAPAKEAETEDEEETEVEAPAKKAPVKKAAAAATAPVKKAAAKKAPVEPEEEEAPKKAPAKKAATKKK